MDWMLNTKKVFKTLKFDEEEHKKDFARVIAKFNEHFEPKKLVKLYMKKFDSCYQKDQETIGEYLSRLRDIAQYCEYGDILDNQLCKQLSIGVKSRELKDKLWSDVLTLDQIIKKGHIFEQRLESKDILETKSCTEVHYMSRGHGRNSFNGAGRSHRDRSQAVVAGAEDSSMAHKHHLWADKVNMVLAGFSRKLGVEVKVHVVIVEVTTHHNNALLMVNCAIVVI